METDFEVLDREAEQIVKDIGIPPCPMILTKLMQEMRSDEPNFPKLGKLIGGDVSLAASMLKTVNSPFYGLRNKATSVPQAIALLGLRHVAELVAGLLLRQAFPGGTSDLMDEFWETSSGIAQINALLARQFKHIDRDAAQTFGLFRDCGMLALMQRFKHYNPVFPGAKRDRDESVTGSEEKHCGINHARVGYQMAKTWLLPDGICLAVLRHHDYAELQANGAGIPVASLQHIALTLAAESIFVKQEFGETSAEWALGSAFALEQMGITQAELDEIAGTIASELAAHRH
jgi:HD-like signal output (HDOD) protein